MKSTVVDFYSGFEGEPELRFVQNTVAGEEFIVRIWMGFFHYIMDGFVPSSDGWKGLALPYHTCQGWYEGNPWKVDNIEEAYNEWMTLDKEKVDKSAFPVWRAIGDLLCEAKYSSEDVWIFYD